MSEMISAQEGIQTVVEAGLNTGFLQFVETDNASTTQRLGDLAQRDGFSQTAPDT